jgi:arginase
MSEVYPQRLDLIVTPSAAGGPEHITSHTSGPGTLCREISAHLTQVGHTVRRTDLEEHISLPEPELDAEIINQGIVGEVCRSVASRTKTALADGYLPVNLYTDHSSAMGSVSGALMHEKQDVALLWIDAHLDFHDPEHTPSRRAHGMPVSFLARTDEFRAFRSLAQRIGWQPSDLPLLGLPRIANLGMSQISLTKPELARLYDMEKVQELGLNHVLRELEDFVAKYRWIYVSWDLDSVQVQGTGLPPDFGFTWREAAQIARWLDRRVRRQGKLMGLDLVEFMPELDASGKTTELARSLMLRTLGLDCFNDPLGLRKHLDPSAPGH